MPLTPKGEKIMSAMQEQYGKERGKSVFYASKNKGTIEGVDASDDNLASHGGVGTGDGPNVTAAPHPVRRPNLLGVVATNEGIPPAKVKGNQASPPGEGKARDADTSMLGAGGMGSVGASTGGGMASTGPMPMMDKSKGKDEAVGQKAQPPMNNLSPGTGGRLPGDPGTMTGKLIPYQGHQVGDSLKNQNVRNRQFWARRPK